MKHIYLISLCVLLALACQQNKSTGTFDLNRLVGRWEVNNGQTRQIEEWGKGEEGTYRGRGYALFMGDTSFIEYLSIRQVEGKMAYVAQVSDQNDAQEVPFFLTRQSESFVEFTNSSHDFPKRIVYTVLSDTTILAYIEGPKDGEDVRVDYLFVKK